MSLGSLVATQVQTQQVWSRDEVLLSQLPEVGVLQEPGPCLERPGSRTLAQNRCLVKVTVITMIFFPQERAV